MAKRKTLYQLCQSHANGFLLREDYRQARRALVSDILERKFPLQERDYPSCDGTQKKPGDTAIRTRRHMARDQVQQLAQIRKESGRRGLRRGRIALALAVILGLLLALGAILLPLTTVPASPKLEETRSEYELKGDIAFLRDAFGSSPALADAGIRQRLDQLRNADPQRYADLAPEFTQQLAGRIERLLAANPQQAAQLASGAAALFPESSQLQDLLARANVPPWSGEEARTALNAFRLTQAGELLAAAPPGNPNAQEMKRQLQQQREQAKQAYDAFVTARAGAGTNAQALRAAEKQLTQARSLWTDNPEYAGAGQALKSALAAAAKPRLPRLIRRNQDVTRITIPAGEPAAKQPIASENTCVTRLATHGRRAKAACFDMISDGLRGPLMVVIPAGETLFGDQENLSKQKQLAFSSVFAISKYEISINDYNKYCHLSKACALIKENKDLPVTQISAEEAVNYANWLSERTGKTYRLPKAEEWEYAAWAHGKQPKGEFNCRVVLGVKILKGTGLTSVKSGKSNAWGLKNYLGNAQEWVYAGNEWHARGGAYSDPMPNCTPELDRPHTGAADGTTGFRVVLEDIG